jgi:preprotein translocase subunit SecF
MSRVTTAIILTCTLLVIWFYVEGQAIQSLEITFVLGLVIGTLGGLWIGGGRVLRKLRKEEHERVDTTYKQRTDKHL